MEYWNNQNPNPCPLKNKQFSRNEGKSYIPSYNADSSVQTVICKAQSVFSARHAVKCNTARMISDKGDYISI